MIAFQRDNFCVLEKDIPGWLKIYMSKSKERTWHCKFSKVSVLRKGRSWAFDQDETCLKFRGSEGNINLGQRFKEKYYTNGIVCFLRMNREEVWGPHSLLADLSTLPPSISPALQHTLLCEDGY